MNKPTFTGKYPLVQATIQLRLIKNRDDINVKSIQRDLNELTAGINAALEAGEITKTEFKDLRTYYINSFVDRAFSMVIADRYTNNGQYQSLPQELQWFDYLREARLIGGYEKKVLKLKSQNHPMVKDMLELINELRELQHVVEYLKTIEVSAVTKRETAKVKKAEEARIRNQTDIVYQTVLPLLKCAQDEAEAQTRSEAERVEEILAKHGFDLEKVAPKAKSVYFNGKKNWEATYEAHRKANIKRVFYQSFCEVESSTKDSTILKMSQEAIERKVEQSRCDAAFEFEAYVAKLNAKINDPVLQAELSQVAGVWFDSDLTVVTQNKGTQVWNTKVIVNFSKHGKAFNQFPTRLVHR